MRRLHDEPSRALRIFPGRGRGASTFTLYEDDGHTCAYRDGGCAQVAIGVHWNATEIRVHARKHGRYALPYSVIRVVLPHGERRSLVLTGNRVSLSGAA